MHRSNEDIDASDAIFQERINAEDNFWKMRRCLLANVAAWMTFGESSRAAAAIQSRDDVAEPPVPTTRTEPPSARSSSSSHSDGESVLFEVTDPDTYSALVYAPPRRDGGDDEKRPLLLVLHGAAKNERDVWNLADARGEHSGLPPSLLASGAAPKVLRDNFVVVAPYAGRDRRTFYDDPRSKLLRFSSWIARRESLNVDPNRVFLLGFSDGATVAVELLTTRRFAGAVVAAYGFTGTLPPEAVRRLTGIPLWVFHSADDVIFPVRCSDRLVRNLRDAAATVSAAGDDVGDVVKYTRYDRDQEGFTGDVRGHSTGITASKTPQVYEWLLSLPPTV